MSTPTSSRFPVMLNRIFAASLPVLLWLTACGSKTSSLSNGTRTTIAFSSNRALDGTDSQNNGVFNIWTIKSDGSAATALTQLSGVAYPATSTDPAWSPDGTKVAYSSSRALDGSDSANNPTYGVRNIWVMNADGSGLLR